MSRRRYRWSEENQSMEEVGADYSGAERRAPAATEELTYGGLQATDGTPVNTRRRHREYMKANNVTLASDMTNTWAKAKQEREAFYTPGSGYDRKARREAVAEAVYKLEKKR